MQEIRRSSRKITNISTYTDLEEQKVLKTSSRRPSLTVKVTSSSNTKPAFVEKSCDELRDEIPLIRNSPTQDRPIALLLLGPAGSGKSTIFKKILPSSVVYDYYNLDDYQEKLLELNGILKKNQENDYINNTNEKIKEFIGESKSYEDKKKGLSNILSIVGKMMGISKKCISEDFENIVSNKRNIVIDRPGDKLNVKTKDSILNQINILKENGYTIYVIVVYASIKTVLKRNLLRGRSLLPNIVISVWKNLMNSLIEYKALFGNQFIIIDNDDSDKTVTLDDLRPYISEYVLEKEYSEIQQIYSDPDINKILDKKYTLDEAKKMIENTLPRKNPITKSKKMYRKKTVRQSIKY